MRDIVHSARTFTIRRAVASDAPDIERCLTSAFAEYRDRYTPQAFTDTVPEVDAVRDRIMTMLVLVAVPLPLASAHEVLGTLTAVTTHPEHAHLRGMAVRPEVQGRGIANALLQTMEAELKALSFERVTLGVTTPLLRARLLYESNGFTRTGRVSSFFGMALHEYEKHLTRQGP